MKDIFVILSSKDENAEIIKMDFDHNWDKDELFVNNMIASSKHIKKKRW